MTFPIVLLAIGALLLSIGLLGRIEMDKFRAGTDSTPTRVLVGVMGTVLMIAAYFVYVNEKQGGTSAEANKPAPQASVNVSSSAVTPAPAPGPVFAIDRPRAGAALEVPLVEGTGQIEVKGTLRGLEVDYGKAGVYVFTRTQGESEWWYDEAVDADQNGEWTTTALSGSKTKPTPKDRDTGVTIQAVVAEDEAVNKAVGKNGAKFVRSLDEITYLKMTAPAAIKIRARQ